MFVFWVILAIVNVIGYSAVWGELDSTTVSLILSLGLLGISFIAWFVAKWVCNASDDDFHSVYPKWLLRRLFIRANPPISIIVNKRDDTSMLEIRPFRYSMATQERQFMTNLNNKSRADIIEHVKAMQNEVERRIAKRTSDIEVHTYKGSELDMWEL